MKNRLKNILTVAAAAFTLATFSSSAKLLKQVPLYLGGLFVSLNFAPSALIAEFHFF